MDSFFQLPAWRRFHLRISALYGGAFFLVLTLVAVAFYYFGTTLAMDGLRSRLEARAVSLAATLDPATVGNPTLLVSRLRAAGLPDPEVAGVYVLLPSGKQGIFTFAGDWSRSGQTSAPGEEYDAQELPVMQRGLKEVAVEDQIWLDASGATLSGYAPLREGHGLVGVDVDARDVQEIREQVLWVSAGLYLLAALCLAGVTLAVGRSIREPLGKVVNAASAVALGNFRARVRVSRQDEFGLLAKSFDHMAEGLEERELVRQTFGRFVSREVLRMVLDQNGTIKAEEREVTVLFTDLAAYSTISEHLPPSQVIEMLNAYFTEMNGLVEAHRGTVLEYMGDGLLATFGAPVPERDHAAAAVRCAIAMQRRLAELNEEWEKSGRATLWRQQGVDALRSRIGIHCGRVVAGTIGSVDRMKYGVIGDTVNVAARLEALNKELSTATLASAAVWIFLPDELRARAVPRGRHRVKGREQEVEVWEIRHQEGG